MLTRIVRMSFTEEKVPAFMELFESVKHKIRAFPGCEYLELLQDIDQPNVLMSYSKWCNDDALQRYRQSDFFRGTWKATKVLFSDAPVAYSVNSLEKIDSTL
ncbi:antibiotic biosynthesis monooxygenase family protein [Rapidithrix thailandica]|uniref:Antibiotic biosynthesis monooxygenase family protein n=1 Tax=Rapidithrix thailandica TaxID=413964 RepID=A0AAW9S7B9_9BACT